MRARAGRWLAVGLLLAVVAGACGDDDGETGGGTTTTEGPPTKEQYLPRAEAVCADANIKARAIPDRPSSDQQATARYYEQLLEVYRPALERFREVEPPPPDKPTIDRLLNLRAQSLAKLAEYITAARANNRAAATRANRDAAALHRQYLQVAKPYGFAECAKE